jgi:hypothetical protein
LDYLGPEDPSRMSTEEMLPEEALKRVGHVLMDVHTMPYVPVLFSASNHPKPVSYLFVRVLLTLAHIVSDVCC